MVIRPVLGEGAKKRSSADLKFENFANVSDSILEFRAADGQNRDLPS
jgi:hypothetical protein